MTRRLFALGAPALAAALALAGCARSSTVVDTQVNIDMTAPPLLLLRITVTSATDPSRMSQSAIRSLLIGDAADRPAPFIFPLLLPVSVDRSFAGDVVILLEGLDWDTKAVVAAGSTTATVIAEQHTQAALTLSAVVTPALPDGGAESAAAP